MCRPERLFATSRKGSLRASPRRRWPAMVDGKLVDLTYPLEHGRVGQDRHRQEPRGAAADPSQHRAPAGRGGHEPVSRRAVRHRSGDRRRLLLRLRRPAPVRARRISRRSKRRCASSPSQDLVYERQMWPRDEAKAFFAKRGEPLKVQLIDEKTEGQKDVSVYTIKDKDTFVDFCVGPHVPTTAQAEGVQAAQHLERLLEGRRAQPADAARLRHRVPVREGSQGAPHPARGSEEARPPQARTRARALHLPSVGAGRGVLARQGHDALQHARELHARACCSRPATSRSRRRSSTTRRCGSVRALGALPPEHVPHRVAKARR